MAFINSIIIQWCIELYSDDPKKLKYYIQLIYFMFPVASFISIQTTAPFLSKKHENNTALSGNQAQTESRIDIPFFISSVLSLLCAAIILFFYLREVTCKFVQFSSGDRHSPRFVSP